MPWKIQILKYISSMKRWKEGHQSINKFRKHLKNQLSNFQISEVQHFQLQVLKEEVFPPKILYLRRKKQKLQSWVWRCVHLSSKGHRYQIEVLNQLFMSSLSQKCIQKSWKTISSIDRYMKSKQKKLEWIKSLLKWRRDRMSLWVS